MIIIGITGTHGAGKGAIVNYLVRKYGFAHYSARDFLIEEIKRRAMPVNRDSMHIVANDLRKAHHPGYIAEQLHEQAKTNKKNAVIESIRTLGEVELLRKKGHFYLFAVDADKKVRYNRIMHRKSETDHVSFEKFVEDEMREMETDDPTRQNVYACIKAADYTFKNETSLNNMYRKIDKVLATLQKNEKAT